MKVLIAGCAGKMGIELLRLLLQNDDFGLQIAGGTVSPSSAYLGCDLAQIAGLRVSTDIYATSDLYHLGVDAIIDFTTPSYSCAISAFCAQHHIIHICGTTGFSSAQMAQLIQNAAHHPLLHSANMSVGANVMLELLEAAAAKLGSRYDVDISEVHHKAKKDAPSGTALLMAQVISSARNLPLVLYNALSDGVRPNGAIGISALRSGKTIGQHTVNLTAEEEMLSITHQGFSRRIYAIGACQSALWMADKAPGIIYSMRDVIGGNSCSQSA